MCMHTLIYWERIYETCLFLSKEYFNDSIGLWEYLKFMNSTNESRLKTNNCHNGKPQLLGKKKITWYSNYYYLFIYILPYKSLSFLLAPSKPLLAQWENKGNLSQNYLQFPLKMKIHGKPMNTNSMKPRISLYHIFSGGLVILNCYSEA